MTQTEFELEPVETGQPPYPRPGFSLWDRGEKDRVDRRVVDARIAFIKPIGCTVPTDGPPDLFSDDFDPVVGIFSLARESAASGDGVEALSLRLELDLYGCLDAPL